MVRVKVDREPKRGRGRPRKERPPEEAAESEKAETPAETLLRAISARLSIGEEAVAGSSCETTAEIEVDDDKTTTARRSAVYETPKAAVKNRKRLEAGAGRGKTTPAAPSTAGTSKVVEPNKLPVSSARRGRPPRKNASVLAIQMSPATPATPSAAGTSKAVEEKETPVSRGVCVTKKQSRHTSGGVKPISPIRSRGRPSMKAARPTVHRQSLPRTVKTIAELRKSDEKERKKTPKRQENKEDSSSSSSSGDDSLDEGEPFVKRRRVESDDAAFKTPMLTPRRRRGRPRKSSPSPYGYRTVRAKSPRSPRKNTPKRIVSEHERKIEVFMAQLMANSDEDVAMEATLFDPHDSPVFMNKWAIVDRLDPLVRDARCNRYFVTDLEDGMIEDAELRIYPITEFDRLVFENTFLDRMERIQRSHLVLLPLEHDIVIGKGGANFCYIVNAARSGPSIDSLFQHHDGVLLDRDVARIASGMLEVVEQIIKIGYMPLDVDPSHFALDDESGEVYMRNCRSIGLGYEHHGVSTKGEGLGLGSLRWRGIDKYAPLASLRDPDNPMSECDCLEALFYVIMDLSGRFQLAENYNTMFAAKERWEKANADALKAEMPAALVTFWLMIRRGVRFVYNRTDTLQNGYIIYRENRERRRGAIPTSAYLEYAVLFKSLENLGLLADEVAKPLSICIQERREYDVVLAGALNQLKLELETVEADATVLDREQNARELDDSQLDRERKKNERFLTRFLDLSKTEKAELDKDFDQHDN